VGQQSLRCEDAQRLAQRDPADAEAARHLLLADLLARHQGAIEDLATKPVDDGSDAAPCGRRPGRRLLAPFGCHRLPSFGQRQDARM
jgi:hypothetical protein